MSPETSRACRLEQAVGQVGICPGPRCPFWDDSRQGSGGCTFESLDLRGREQLAGWLLDLRRTLERGDEDARREFFARLNAGGSDE
jgi:hypothetical protein